MSIVEKCKQLLETSVLFTEDQKKAWLDLLPKMNDDELKELHGILADEVLELKKEGIVLIEDPKLETELLSAEIQHGASLDQLKAAAGIAPAPKANFKDELKREVTTPELKGDVQVPIPPPAPVAEAAKPQTKSEVALMDIEAKPLNELVSLSQIRTVQDLKKIQTAHLRQNDLAKQIQLIKSKIIALINANRVLPYYVVNAFEASPLFQTYLSIGEKLITNTNPDRNQAYNDSVEAAQANDEDTLKIEEFEAIADLRKQIEQL